MSSSYSEDQTNSTEETASITPNTSTSSFSEDVSDSGEAVTSEALEGKEKVPTQFEEKKEMMQESPSIPVISDSEFVSTEKKSKIKKTGKSSVIVFTKEEPREAVTILEKIRIGWDGEIAKPSYRGKKSKKTRSSKTAMLLYKLTSDPKHLLKRIEVLHKDASYAKVYKNQRNVEVELTSENSHMPIEISLYAKGWKKTEWIVRDERGIHDSVLSNVTKKHLESPNGRLVFSSQLLQRDQIPLLTLSLDLNHMEKKKGDNRKEMYVAMHSKSCHVFLTFDTFPQVLPVWKDKNDADFSSFLGLGEEISVDGHLLAYSEHSPTDFQKTTKTLTSIGVYTKYMT